MTCASEEGRGEERRYLVAGDEEGRGEDDSGDGVVVGLQLMGPGQGQSLLLVDGGALGDEEAVCQGPGLGQVLRLGQDKGVGHQKGRRLSSVARGRGHEHLALVGHAPYADLLVEHCDAGIGHHGLDHAISTIEKLLCAGGDGVAGEVRVVGQSVRLVAGGTVTARVLLRQQSRHLLQCLVSRVCGAVALLAAQTQRGVGSIGRPPG